MPNQRRLIIKTGSYTGILFDAKDTVTAYQILGRAEIVDLGYSGNTVSPSREGDSIDITLIDPACIKPKPEPELEPAPPAPTPPIADEPLF